MKGYCCCAAVCACRGPASVQDRLGLLQVSAIGTAMSSLVRLLGLLCPLRHPALLAGP